MAFESLSGVKITDPAAKRVYIIADFFSVCDTEQDALPEIYNWSEFKSIAETKAAYDFVLNSGDQSTPLQFKIPKKLIPDPALQIRTRAIIEGAIAANPDVEYKHGRRILPPKTLSSGCEIPTEAYTATGSYQEKELNNSNVVLRNPGFDKAIWICSPLMAVLAFVAQVAFFGNVTVGLNLLRYAAISALAGVSVGMTIYLFCVYAAKTIYGKILNEDIALLEDITFVVCDDGFMAAETEVYNYTDIIRWHQVEFFVETNHAYILSSKNKSVCWLPKRLFPKEIHGEIGDFIAAKLAPAK